MKQMFPGYYRPSDEEFAQLWAECIFVPDTNVLLNLYRYPQSARDDLLRILERIADRLWIPHQVALEYQRNRLAVIGEQMGRYSQVMEVLSTTRKDLQSKLDNLQLRKRHSSIKPNSFLAKVDEIYDEFKRELEALQQEQPDIHDKDEIRDRLTTLFSQKIGSPPTSQVELREWYDEAEARIQQQRPPGYADVDKGSDEVYLHNGMCFERKYGDFVLWKQLLNYAAENDKKYVILITDDGKNDWWWRVNGQTIGPRPELIEEIAAQNIGSFHMYSSEDFMKYAKQHLTLEVKDESIEQVRDVARVARDSFQLLSDLRRRSDLAVDATFNWLSARYPNDKIARHNLGFVDVVLYTPTGKIGHAVLYTRNEGGVFRRIRDWAYRAYYEVHEGDWEAISLVIVVDKENKPSLAELYKRTPTLLSELPGNIEVIIGCLDDEGVFEFVSYLTPGG